MIRAILSLRALALVAIGGCATSAAHPSHVRDARGRFLTDTLVIAAPAYGMYAGTTVPLQGEVWRRGSRSPDGTAPIHANYRLTRRESPRTGGSSPACQAFIR